MSSRPGQSTYGLACMQCYKAKCRCVPGSHGHACERCQRLRKDCQPTEASRRRNPAQRSEQSDSRIAQLEAKVESLLSTLQSTQGQAKPPEKAFSADNTTTSLSADENATPRETDPFFLPPSPPLSQTSQSEAEQCLHLFRTRMLPHFPFISLSPDVSSWELKQTRPFLFQAILTVTTCSQQEKANRAEHFRRLASTSILVKMQSNVDLLLGLLTYLTWNADAFLGGADVVSRLTMMAVSLVYDLRLFKPSAPDAKYMSLMTQGRPPHDDGTNTVDDTALDFIEKQRALLACFVLSSNVSSHLGRQDALRWTTHMEGALQVIENNCKASSCPTADDDKAFAFQVRLHVLKQKAACIREEHDAERSRTGFATATTSLPGLLYLKTLRGQLHDLCRNYLSSDGQPHKDIFQTYAQHTELYLNQLAYSLSWDSPRLDLSAQRIDLGLNPGYERLECLWRSVENIKSWLHHFYLISSPSFSFIGLPFHFWSHMIRCLVILKYLAVLNDPSWDRQAVRRHVDPVVTCDLVAERIRMALPEGQEEERNLFGLLIKLLQGCKLWAQTKLDMSPLQQQEDILAVHSEQERCTLSELSMEQQIPEFDQMGILQSMDLGSEVWLGGLFQE